MDGTIPTEIGTWLLETAITLLKWPGPFGYGVVAMATAPPIIRWLANLPGIRKGAKVKK